jgi:hypothetical protein
MSKKPTKTDDGFIRFDPDSPIDGIDKNIKLPRQVRLGIARAEALIAGRQPPPFEVTSAKSEKALPYTDAQIDAVLAWLDLAKLDSSNPEFGIIAIELAREGARLTKAHRRGAQKPRKKSEAVKRRMEALFQAFWELPPKFQRYPTGQKTIERLRKAVIQKLSLPDNDDVLSEDTIIHCIRELRPLIRLVQKGKIPPPGQPYSKPEKLSEQTRREMERGREVSARHAAAKAAAGTSPEPPAAPSDDRNAVASTSPEAPSDDF